MSAAAGLIADIGATNARFALADDKGFYEQKVLQCADFPSIVDATKAYLDGIGQQKPKHAAFAIAGPISGDYFEMTNHLWSFSIQETQKSLDLDAFTLLNDFKAIALGIPHLTDADLVKVGGGNPQPQATIGIVGPGTGLGVASLFWDGKQYRANSGEGGHITMPAKTQRNSIFSVPFDTSTAMFLPNACVFGQKGLINIYNAIRVLDGRDDIPERTAEEISVCAIAKTCTVCEEALDKMMGFLGCIAGDLAVTLGSFGGVYIAGGIPAKLGDYFLTSRFRSEFEAKGRFDAYLKPIPTYLITHPYTAFVGLQHYISNEQDN